MVTAQPSRTSPSTTVKIVVGAWCALACLARLTFADPVATVVPTSPSEPPPPPQTPPAAEPSASDVANAPVPGAESGRTDQVDGGDSAARQAARAALWLPKILFEGLTEPLYGATWAYNQYDLGNRYYDLFYNRDRTLGFRRPPPTRRAWAR